MCYFTTKTRLTHKEYGSSALFSIAFCFCHKLETEAQDKTTFSKGNIDIIS